SVGRLAVDEAAAAGRVEPAPARAERDDHHLRAEAAQRAGARLGIVGVDQRRQLVLRDLDEIAAGGEAPDERWRLVGRLPEAAAEVRVRREDAARGRGGLEGGERGGAARLARHRRAAEVEDAR